MYALVVYGIGTDGNPPPPGIPIRTTLDNATTVQYAGLVHQLTGKARTTVRDLDPTNDLSFLRLRTLKNEIMIAPGEGGAAFLVSSGWGLFEPPSSFTMVLV